MVVEVVNRDRSAPFITKDRSEIRSILDRTNSTATNQSLAEATLPPGAETDAHFHPRTEEIYCCCSPPYSHEDTVLTG